MQIKHVLLTLHIAYSVYNDNNYSHDAYDSSINERYFYTYYNNIIITVVNISTITEYSK